MLINSEVAKLKLQIKLECLKLSYEINFKIGNIKNSCETPQQAIEDLKEVFTLSDMYFQYLINDEYPEYEEEGIETEDNI